MPYVGVDEFVVADPAHAWRRAGFSVDSTADSAATCRIGGVRIRLAPDSGAGIVGWSLRNLPQVDALDGIPTTVSSAPAAAPASHANGVTAIDHVVLMSPDLDRTVRALAAVGIDPRRKRDAELGGRPIRQIFFRLGEVILEVVGSPGVVGDGPGAGPSTLWGITYVVADIDATAAFFGDHTAPIKDAVQPGRRITTVRHRELGMSVPTAMISAP